MNTYNPCVNCSHGVMCAWKGEYKELNEKIIKFQDEEIDSNKFCINLLCNYCEDGGIA